MNIHVKAAVALALGAALPAAYATNGDQMLGVNATQWGMAGAIVAAPQDAGTVLTNPGALGFLEMEEVRFDMGFGFLNPERKINGVESDSNLYLIPSGAVAFRSSDRLSIGMGMAGLSGMGVDVGDISAAAAGNQNVVTTKQFFKIAPGFAYRASDNLSVGAALNIDYQSLAMDLNLPFPPPGGTTMHLPQNQVFGFGASLGLVYKFTDKLQLGFAYISQQYMDEFKWNTSNGTFRMTMDAPAQTSLGLAFRPDPSWLIEADVKHIAFSEVLDKLDLQTPAGTKVMNFGWDDQIVYALGVQKQVNAKTQLRFGVNYGKSPIESEDVNSNLGSLAVTELHYSLGLTRQLSNKVSSSLSYVKAMPNEVTSSVGPANTIELEQNIVNFQISYKN